MKLRLSEQKPDEPKFATVDFAQEMAKDVAAARKKRKKKRMKAQGILGDIEVG